MSHSIAGGTPQEARLAARVARKRWKSAGRARMDREKAWHGDRCQLGYVTPDGEFHAVVRAATWNEAIEQLEQQ